MHVGSKYILTVPSYFNLCFDQDRSLTSFSCTQIMKRPQACETKATVKTYSGGEGRVSKGKGISPVSKSVSSIADAFSYLKASKSIKSLGFVSEMLSKESKHCSAQFRQ